MYKIKLYNNIAQKGLDRFNDRFLVGDDLQEEDAIIVRSANLHDLDYADNLKAIARAGAGVNNIDLETCTQKGIVVFNTPGANSNAVKELVFAGLLLASRDIYHGIEWAKSQSGNENLSKDVEKQKKKYAGNEITGKTLGVIGLGAIGIQVANLALRFGMQVEGYDPYISVDNAWSMSRWVNHVKDEKELFANADYISLHLPLMDSTKNTINKETIALMKDGVKILNFARGGLVNDEDMLEALNSGKVAVYVTDFPSPLLADHPHVIPIPHLGASTDESEENCAIKAADEVMEYLTTGNIINSVNMPNAFAPFTGNYRICVIHENKPKMISQITDKLASEDANIENLLNKSKKEIAYTILDLDQKPSEKSINEIKEIRGVVRVEVYEK
ncbi:phosphoglycerate dehydrogenase [Dubosiella newyorkensis]|jgi:D-3-phosphoglycerate dehydrogenase|uniref:D-3-phosphoglycerate dehydrogenase n=1 Tax=Dubosiella newyorkensis TaxID=1862672 RepID=A0A1U7NJZ4_9FIRM|nr:phosphoglycerate dehydrogenase [Dubosiella newyorkensis]MCI9042093.1 phosphoglycerate dehydrogenase [Dubosiella newyorkensis]OLU44325.1 3-phosphoglycerate dehydrogenase [Dubosiella newyorkensis]